jgi:hypothetical protein
MKIAYRPLIWFTLTFLFLSALFPAAAVMAAEPADPDTPSAGGNGTIYLPMTVTGYTPKHPLMLGIYPHSYWQPGVQDALDQEFNPVDSFCDKNISIAGVFHSINQYNTVNSMLPIIWDNGYTPFVNIYFKNSAYAIAKGDVDHDIRAWARDFAAYAKGGQRMAYLAPMQEMNGYWVPYGLDPQNFKIAFERIQKLFAEEGVPDQSVRWVFAANGYSDPTHPPFEDYYPGPDLVDVVAFSAYNFGYHRLNPYKDWETPQEVFTPYLKRMVQMAPDKPIFISQTGTTAYYNSTSSTNTSMKNQWLEQAYNLMLENRSVWAVIYYNDNMNYDWAFYKDGLQYPGYCSGISDPSYTYIPPTELMQTNLAIH